MSSPCAARPACLPALHLLVSPSSAVRTPDWARVCAGLGTLLPSDYRALMESYGAGEWSEWLSLCPPEDLAGLPGPDPEDDPLARFVPREVGRQV